MQVWGKKGNDILLEVKTGHALVSVISRQEKMPLVFQKWQHILNINPISLMTILSQFAFMLHCLLIAQWQNKNKMHTEQQPFAQRFRPLHMLVLNKAPRMTR